MSFSSETLLKLSHQWDDTVRALQLKPNFFWLWCHPQPHCGEYPTWLMALCFQIILQWFFCFSHFHDPSVGQSAVDMCCSQTLCLRSGERKAFPLVFTWPAAFFSKLDGVVEGQGGEMVFDKDQNEGIPRWLCGLAFLMGSNPKRGQTVWVLGKEPPTAPPLLLTATALCSNGFLESTSVHS